MTNPNVKTLSAFCPSCDTRIRFDERPKLFDIVTCPECEEEVEVVGLSPIRLDWPSDFVDEDDWSYDDDDPGSYDE